MRQRDRALDVVLDRLAGGVGEIVDRQDDDVVAHADAAVLALVAPEARVFQFHDDYQRLVLTLCTCRCSPLAIGFTTRPMSTPYLMTVSPSLWSLSETLWPMGMSLRATTSMSLSSSMIQPVRCWPALMPSTTTTPTPSPSSCTTKWIMRLFYSDVHAPPLPAGLERPARRLRGGASLCLGSLQARRRIR